MRFTLPARWAVFTLLFWALVLVYAPRNFGDAGGDSAQYIILAESLAGGHGYHALDFPGAPFYYHYPPVFPLLLAPIVYFFGRNFFLMHLMVAGFGFGALLVFFKLFRKCADDKIAFMATVLLALSVPFSLYLIFYILSDVILLFFMALAFLFLTDYRNALRVWCRPAVLSVLFLNLAYFTRYAGLEFSVAAVLALSWGPCSHKKKKIAFIVLGVAVPVALWQITAQLLNPGCAGQYLQQFPQDGLWLFLARVGNDLAYYAINISVFFFNHVDTVVGDNLGYLFSFLVAILAVVGMVRYVSRRGETIIFTHFVLYLLLIAVWPFGYGDRLETMRFILPLIPVLAFFMAEGLNSVFGRLAGKANDRWFWLFPIVLAVTMAWSLRVVPPGKQRIRPASRYFIEAHQWIRANCRDQGVVLSRKPSITYFYSGHQALRYPYSSDPAQIWRVVEDYRVKYIVIDAVHWQTQQFLTPVIGRYRDRLKLVYTSPGALVFEVLDEKSDVFCGKIPS